MRPRCRIRITGGRVMTIRGFDGVTRRTALGLMLSTAAASQFAARPGFGQQGGSYKIGVLSDMSGIVVDLSGPGTVVSMQLAIEDFGGKVLGKPIELVRGDHLNKPDVGIGLARKWYDEGVNAIFDIGITSVALGVQQLARERNKTVVFISSSSADLTEKSCSPNGVHWNHNSYSQAIGIIKSAIAAGNDTFFFMTVDYAYGHTVQSDTTKMIEANGGKVVGAAPHAFETTDFSSDLLKAQSSGAKVIALATTSVHVPNIVKQSDEFGIRPAQMVAPLSITLHDVKAMGLPIAQGILETSTYYWDQNDETRAFAKRFFDRFKKMPNMIQASAYGAVMHYLKAVEAVGSDDTGAIMDKMRATPVNDFMSKNARITANGQVFRDQVVLQVKTPAESTGEWDLYKTVGSVPADQAFAPPNPALCSIVKA
jgi:branched-chain amino acid transport system substrate-binding protein